MNDTPTPTPGATQELLPCPFCGQADFVRIIDDGVSPIRVVCYNRHGYKGCGAAGRATGMRNSAITAWNTRAETSDLRAALEEARDAMLPIVEDAKGRLGHTFEETNWNEDYQIEIQITVAEFRAINAALTPK